MTTVAGSCKQVLTRFTYGPLNGYGLSIRWGSVSIVSNLSSPPLFFALPAPSTGADGFYALLPAALAA
jgi:hypothetical protein